MGKSTLQRRAKAWRDMGHAAPVKSVLVTLPQAGDRYRIDRDDFLAWIFDCKSNLAPHETSADLARSPEAPAQPTAKSEKTDMQPGAGETPADTHNDKYVRQLERENVMLHRQIDTMTSVVESTLENVKQQNILIQGFQRMLGLAAPSHPTATPPHSLPPRA